MPDETTLAYGLSDDLKNRIEQEYIHEGALYGHLPQKQLSPEEMRALKKVGWTPRDYRDNPIMEAPQSTINWDQLSAEHRDHVLHAISHRLPQGAPWAGNRQAILEELIASAWDEREEEMRILLNSWTFAAAWSGHPNQNDRLVESRQTFYFYTAKMRDTAEQALHLATEPPGDDDAFWGFVEALNS
ncbi:hypothetical protein [Sulfobacillus sp. hq2]|uniref:hypothetical protein n=1 Tax=Sulfobacillus TaxID=28033 RepID=UPI000CD1EC9C|nr:hypothetical protein [Sulfobacillus sp. hq2]POB09648.1 hypothetical protein CO251_15705 [Sulfobacillus sp. hq2]